MKIALFTPIPAASENGHRGSYSGVQYTNSIIGHGRRYDSVALVWRYRAGLNRVLPAMYLMLAHSVIQT